MGREWIGYLVIQPSTAAKIRTKHNLTEEQVREAVSFGRYERARFKEDTPYGPRLLVDGTTADGTRLMAWLRPIDRTDGTWECMTAVPLP